MFVFIWFVCLTAPSSGKLLLKIVRRILLRDVSDVDDAAATAPVLLHVSGAESWRRPIGGRGEIPAWPGKAAQLPALLWLPERGRWETLALLVSIRTTMAPPSSASMTLIKVTCHSAEFQLIHLAHLRCLFR